MEAKTIISKFKITNDEEYKNTKDIFAKFIQEAKSIINFLSGPKKNENIILVKDERISSDYLNNLRNKLFDLEDSLLDYNQAHPRHYNDGIILEEGSDRVDIGKYLKMYEFYLRDKKNPENLNFKELKNIEYIPIEPYYQIYNPKSFLSKLFGN